MSLSTAIIDIQALAHVGVRVTAFEHAVSFYRQLGFQVTRDDRQERVVVLSHPGGVELNLLDSATDANNGDNVLMDMPARYPGYTHIALQVADIQRTAAAVEAAGIPVTEGPVTFGDGSKSIFMRDPDRNVIELTQPRHGARAA